MAKWADFLVSSVHYNEEHTRIIEVKTRQHLDSGISNNVIRKKRSDVVTDLNQKITYKTIVYNNSKNVWHKGEDVRVKTIGATNFITTDPNETTKDNLGDLPEY